MSDSRAPADGSRQNSFTARNLSSPSPGRNLSAAQARPERGSHRRSLLVTINPKTIIARLITSTGFLRPMEFFVFGRRRMRGGAMRGLSPLGLPPSSADVRHLTSVDDIPRLGKWYLYSSRTSTRRLARLHGTPAVRPYTRGVNVRRHNV